MVTGIFHRKLKHNYKNSDKNERGLHNKSQHKFQPPLGS